MIKVALFVRLRARSGKEAEVEKFLAGALPAAQAERDTTVRSALKIRKGEVGLCYAVPDHKAGKALLNGRIAAALMKRADELFSEPPKIEQIDMLASKVPA